MIGQMVVRIEQGLVKIDERQGQKIEPRELRTCRSGPRIATIDVTR
jgi:hypothetical protein